MNKILFIAFALICTLSFSQAEEKLHNTVALEVAVGSHSLIGSNSSSNLEGAHLDFLLRKNFNRTFGLGLRGAYNGLNVTSDRTSRSQDMYYITLGLEAFADLFDIMDVKSRGFTILAHGGPGISWTDYRTAAILSGGFTGLIKLGDEAAIKATYIMNANINEPNTFDNVRTSTNSGISSMVNTFAVGFSLYLGDKDNGHADWMPENRYDINHIYRSDTTIINNHYSTIVPAITKDINIRVQEAVFFAHNKHKVRKSELNAIQQIYNELKWDEGCTVDLVGWASATSSSDEFNQALSERRSAAIKLKLTDMGIDGDRIKTGSFGKDFNLDKENVHDMARRVELLIIR